MKMKSIWSLIIGIFLLLCVLTFGIVGISRAMAEVDEALESAKNEVDKDGTEGGENDGAGGDHNSNDEVKPVTFTMRSEPEFGFSDHPDNGYTGIRFIADLPATVVGNIMQSDSHQVYCLIAPLDYFDQVYDETATFMDWVGAFEKAGLEFLKIPCKVRYEIVNGRANPVLSAVITDIKYTNVNRNFSAIAFVEKMVDSSNVIRTYAAYPEGEDYRTIARSLGWLAIDLANKHQFGGVVNNNNDEYIAFMLAMDDSYDVMKGQTSDTPHDNSFYRIDSILSTMTLGMDQVSEISYLSEQLPVTALNEPPILWVSENTAIATVDNGVVTGVNPGTTNIIVVLCGVKYTVSVTVTE